MVLLASKGLAEKKKKVSFEEQINMKRVASPAREKSSFRRNNRTQVQFLRYTFFAPPEVSPWGRRRSIWRMFACFHQSEPNVATRDWVLFMWQTGLRAKLLITSIATMARQRWSWLRSIPFARSSSVFFLRLTHACEKVLFLHTHSSVDIVFYFPHSFFFFVKVRIQLCETGYKQHEPRGIRSERFKSHQRR